MTCYLPFRYDMTDCAGSSSEDPQLLLLWGYPGRGAACEADLVNKFEHFLVQWRNWHKVGLYVC